METNIVNNSGSVAISEFREQRGADLINNIKNKSDKMKEIYEATNPETGDKRCGFYDPDVPNGGPQPYEVVSQYIQILAIEILEREQHLAAHDIYEWAK